MVCFCVLKKEEECLEMKEEKQKKGEEIKMKSIMQNAGNKRNNINSLSSNNNNISDLSNSKY